MNKKEISSNISLVYRDIENTYSDSKSILADIMKHANDNFEEIENIYRLVAMISFYKNNYSQRGGEILFEEFSKNIPEFRRIYKVFAS
ncbi:hypothetical protein DW272_01540 [Blautia obeum]|uniref:Uncharacterized protein n=1 Tax=Blautia obeum TaxID=40520 RepID=A0A414SK15_9FIRM|nr:hypothetical protein [Blautia obeum]RHG19916.1 hypothetical protein DW272_01540 [Blautia obeum]